MHPLSGLSSETHNGDIAGRKGESAKRRERPSSPSLASIALYCLLYVLCNYRRPADRELLTGRDESFGVTLAGWLYPR